MKLFAVTGNPILFSKSPAIHNRWLLEKGIDGVYTRLSAESAEEAVSLAKELGVIGLNVTAPFKESIIASLEELDDSAKKLEAVNTITFDEKKATGYNTDAQGVGFALRDIKLDGRSVCIIGNGGAAKAAIQLLSQRGAKVQLLARTEKLGAVLLSSSLSEKIFSEAEIIVSTIPAGVPLPENWMFKPTATLLDAVYSSESYLTRKARDQNIRIIDGTKWLTGQAIGAFSLFTKSSPSAQIDSSNDRKSKSGPVFLTGMMGSGKSRTLEQLKLLGYSICDLDLLIEQRVGKKTSEIFSQKGEVGFRIIERDVLATVVDDKSTFDIIACGGGTPTYPSSAKILESGTVIWLWCSPAVLAKRITDDGARPLLSGQTGEENIRESLEALLAKRFSQYAKTSDLIINSAFRTPKEIASRIQYEINSTR